MEFLSQELVAGFTGLQVLFALVIAAAIPLVLKSLFGGRKAEEHVQTVRGECICGWSGNVSKFTRTCPKCNKQILVGGE